MRGSILNRGTNRWAIITEERRGGANSPTRPQAVPRESGAAGFLLDEVTSVRKQPAGTTA